MLQLQIQNAETASQLHDICRATCVSTYMYIVSLWIILSWIFSVLTRWRRLIIIIIFFNFQLHRWSTKKTINDTCICIIYNLYRTLIQNFLISPPKPVYLSSYMYMQQPIAHVVKPLLTDTHFCKHLQYCTLTCHIAVLAVSSLNYSLNLFIPVSRHLPWFQRSREKLN